MFSVNIKSRNHGQHTCVNARMCEYERVNGINQDSSASVTTSLIATQDTYIVESNRQEGAVYDEITITTLSEGNGNVVGMYRTGQSDVFTIRDVKHRGRLQVQLVPHLKSVRHTERLTWRLVSEESTVQRLVDEDIEVW